MGRACNDGGTNGEGAVPESGVKKGDVVGLRGPGENDDGPFSVYALWSDVVLCAWCGPFLLLAKSK